MNRRRGQHRRGAGQRLRAWLAAHLQAGISSLGRMVRYPGASLITSGVIGITLSLPAALYFALDDLSQALAGLDRQQTISLYLRQEISLPQARMLADTLRREAGIGTVELIDADTGLRQFRHSSGLDQALALLDDNPLPNVLVVTPLLRLSPTAIETLQQRLARHPEVALAQYDQQWVRRLDAILTLAGRATGLIAVLLAVAVLVIVGNTIRMAIDQRRDEIVIGKLFGATDRFIRRPFLYTGAGYGLAAGVIACALLGLAAALLQGPVTRLSLLYGNDFRLLWITPGHALGLVGAGLLLGLVGAGITVARHLREIEPQ